MPWPDPDHYTDWVCMQVNNGKHNFYTAIFDRMSTLLQCNILPYCVSHSSHIYHQCCLLLISIYSPQFLPVSCLMSQRCWQSINLRFSRAFAYITSQRQPIQKTKELRANWTHWSKQVHAMSMLHRHTPKQLFWFKQLIYSHLQL